MSSKNRRKKHSQKNDSKSDVNDNMNITAENDGEKEHGEKENDSIAEQGSETEAAELALEDGGTESVPETVELTGTETAEAEGMPENNIQEEDSAESEVKENALEEENKTDETIEEDIEKPEESASEEAHETPETVTENAIGSSDETKPEEKKSSFEYKEPNVFKTAIVLGVIMLIAALMLSVVHGATAPVIQERALREKAEAVQNLFGSDITIQKYMGEFSSPVVEILLIRDISSESLIGYCVSAVPKGFGGEIDMLVALNAAKKITGIDILDISETAGIGSQVDESGFLSQFIGKSGSIDEKQVDIISGATISSKAVLSGISKALENMKDVEE